jgi:hypothetical protein
VTRTLVSRFISYSLRADIWRRARAIALYACGICRLNCRNTRAPAMMVGCCVSAGHPRARCLRVHAKLARCVQGVHDIFSVHQVRLWNPVDGKQIGPALTGHKQWITSLAWQPLHETGQSRLLASGGKDGTVRIWDTTLYKCERILSGHTQCITCVRWGGTGLIYSASQDRTIKGRSA